MILLTKQEKCRLSGWCNHPTVNSTEQSSLRKTVPGNLEFLGRSYAWAPHSGLINDQGWSSWKSSSLLPPFQIWWVLDTNPKIWTVLMKSIWEITPKIEWGRSAWNLPQMVMKKSRKIFKITPKDCWSQSWKPLVTSDWSTVGHCWSRPLQTISAAIERRITPGRSTWSMRDGGLIKLRRAKLSRTKALIPCSSIGRRKRRFGGNGRVPIEDQLSCIILSLFIIKGFNNAIITIRIMKNIS